MNQKQGAPNLEIMSVRLPDVRVGDMVSLNDPRGHRRWVRVIGLFQWGGAILSSVDSGREKQLMSCMSPHLIIVVCVSVDT